MRGPLTRVSTVPSEAKRPERGNKSESCKLVIGREPSFCGYLTSIALRPLVSSQV